jgi:DnaJ-class molecular chaperone
MICPECHGNGFIKIPEKEINCPTCEGDGELPDTTLHAKHCPACGEPIGEDQDWCEEHKAAAFIKMKEDIL